jgi:hypothetical protein
MVINLITSTRVLCNRVTLTVKNAVVMSVYSLSEFIRGRFVQVLHAAVTSTVWV